MNLAWRDIRHNLGRFVLTCAGLALLLGVVMAMIGIYRGIVVDALAIARTPMADIWVVQAKSRGPFAEASRIPGDVRESIARMWGVESAGAITYQTAEAVVRGALTRLYVVGFETGRPGAPANIIQGRAIARDHYEMIADVSSGLKPGDRVRLGRVTFSVAGLTSQQISSGGDPAVYITLADAQRLQFDLDPAAARNQQARGAPPASRDTVNAVVARVNANADPAIIADTIRRWKHFGALTQAEQEDILSRSLVDRARRQIGLFTALLLAVSGVIIALIIYTMTMEKLKQIAMLKLIGAPDRTIIGMILQQALALGLIGFSLGAVLIYNIKDKFPRRVILEADNVLMLAGIVLAVCFLASLIGVRMAIKADPASAIGG